MQQLLHNHASAGDQLSVDIKDTTERRLIGTCKFVQDRGICRNISEAFYCALDVAVNDHDIAPIIEGDVELQWIGDAIHDAPKPSFHAAACWKAIERAATEPCRMVRRQDNVHARIEAVKEGILLGSVISRYQFGRPQGNVVWRVVSDHVKPKALIRRKGTSNLNELIVSFLRKIVAVSMSNKTDINCIFVSSKKFLVTFE